MVAGLYYDRSPRLDSTRCGKQPTSNSATCRKRRHAGSESQPLQPISMCQASKRAAIQSVSTAAFNRNEARPIAKLLRVPSKPNQASGFPPALTIRSRGGAGILAAHTYKLAASIPECRPQRNQHYCCIHRITLNQYARGEQQQEQQGHEESNGWFRCSGGGAAHRALLFRSFVGLGAQLGCLHRLSRKGKVNLMTYRFVRNVAVADLRLRAFKGRILLQQDQVPGLASPEHRRRLQPTLGPEHGLSEHLWVFTARWGQYLT